MGRGECSLESVGGLTSHFWLNRSVFVTGATGFVGSWLVKRLLADGARVVALVQESDPLADMYRRGDNAQRSTVFGELEDYEKLEKAVGQYQPEVVFHLGAQAIVGEAQIRPLETFETNIRGTYNLLEACRVHGDNVRRVVVASSDKAYGEQRNLPYTEDMSLLGRFPYEASKACADLISQTYYHSYGLPVVIARCGNIFGGGDLNWSRIVPGTIKSFLREERPVIRSDGHFVRDYIYVQDVVEGYLRMAERLDTPQVQGEAFNLCNESPLSVLELVKTIQELMECGHLEPHILNHAAGEIHSQYLSAGKARDFLGWKPQFDLRYGLSETIEWYREHLG